jgi:exodeoxyribonuclease VII large subunit
MPAEPPPVVFTVHELTAYIKRLFQQDEVLQDVIVRGEVSNLRRHRSGHIYFTLKDEAAALECVCFRTVAPSLGFELADGMQVVAGGRVTVYEKQGRYQLIVVFMRPDGVGALYAAFERLRAKLEAEGLFDASRKRSLPRFPRCIALVTSPTGAAVRDLVSIISRRYPPARIIIFPTLVQGDGAPESIVASLRAADSHPAVDLIIVGRGGGSLEDLWAFNDERVARALFACHRPTISAVGHETDFTIADLVADVRAPTPSAAAELAVPDATELLQHLDNLARRALSATRAALRRAQGAWARLLARRPLAHPSTLLEEFVLRVDEASEAAERAVQALLQRARYRLDLAAAGLAAHRPHKLLQRRYEHLASLRRRLEMALVRALERARAQLAVSQVRLQAQHPQRLLGRQRAALAALAQRSHTALHHSLQRGAWRLERLSAQLGDLDPRAVLRRGYSLTFRLPDEQLVRSARQVQPPDRIKILLGEGEVGAQVTAAWPSPSAPSPPAGGGSGAGRGDP